MVEAVLVVGTVLAAMAGFVAYRGDVATAVGCLATRIVSLGGACEAHAAKRSRTSAPVTAASPASTARGVTCDRNGRCTDASGNCFAAGTPVWTPSGERAIEDIAPGDLVMAADPQRGVLTAKRVVRTMQHVALETLRITVAGARGVGTREIVVTPEHPFYTQSGWTAAGALHAGEGLYAPVPAADVSLTAVTQDREERMVFNLEVADLHTYFVTDAHVLVHNQCAPPFVGPPAPGRVVEVADTNALVLPGTRYGVGDVEEILERFYAPPRLVAQLQLGDGVVPGTRMGRATLAPAATSPIPGLPSLSALLPGRPVSSDPPNAFARLHARRAVDAAVVAGRPTPVTLERMLAAPPDWLATAPGDRSREMREAALRDELGAVLRSPNSSPEAQRRAFDAYAANFRRTATSDPSFADHSAALRYATRSADPAVRAAGRTLVPFGAVTLTARSEAFHRHFNGRAVGDRGLHDLAAVIAAREALRVNPQDGRIDAAAVNAAWERLSRDPSVRTRLAAIDDAAVQEVSSTRAYEQTVAMLRSDAFIYRLLLDGEGAEATLRGELAKVAAVNPELAQELLRDVSLRQQALAFETLSDEAQAAAALATVEAYLSNLNDHEPLLAARLRELDIDPQTVIRSARSAGADFWKKFAKAITEVRRVPGSAPELLRSLTQGIDGRQTGLAHVARWLVEAEDRRGRFSSFGAALSFAGASFDIMQGGAFSRERWVGTVAQLLKAADGGEAFLKMVHAARGWQWSSLRTAGWDAARPAASIARVLRVLGPLGDLLSAYSDFNRGREAFLARNHIAAALEFIATAADLGGATSSAAMFGAAMRGRAALGAHPYIAFGSAVVWILAKAAKWADGDEFRDAMRNGGFWRESRPLARLPGAQVSEFGHGGVRITSGRVVPGRFFANGLREGDVITSVRINGRTTPIRTIADLERVLTPNEAADRVVTFETTNVGALPPPALRPRPLNADGLDAQGAAARP